MTNRVLLDASGLKISQPGYDVFSTPNRFMNFTSDWAQANMHTKGVVYLYSGQYSQTVYFGTSFSTHPLAIFRAQYDGSADFCYIGGTHDTRIIIALTPSYFTFTKKINNTGTLSYYVTEYYA